MADNITERTKEQVAEQGGMSFCALKPWMCRGCWWAHLDASVFDDKLIHYCSYATIPQAWLWDKGECMMFRYSKPQEVMMPEKYDWSEYDNVIFCEYFIEEDPEQVEERLNYESSNPNLQDKAEERKRKQLKEKYGLILPTLEERIKKSWDDYDPTIV